MKYRIFLLLILILTAIVGVSLLAKSKVVAQTQSISEPQFQTASAFGETARADSFGQINKRVSKTNPVVRDLPNQTSLFQPKPEDRSPDAALATSSLLPMPTPSLTFDGLANYDNINAFNLLIMPPDMNGDVGPNHYVQTTNSLVRVYDKNGTAVTNPFKLSSLFSVLNTTCSTRDDGLPIVLYDPMADRWLITQYCNAFPPFRQMLAVSKTGDPAGAYYAYEFVIPNIRINDFTKFGVWPDGYYASTEEFIGADYSGQGMYAYDRVKILNGDPTAGVIYFTRASASTARRGNILPSDMDGLRAPAIGAPNVFVSYLASEYGDPIDAIQLYDFRANFADPLQSTFTERPESPIEVADFDPTSPPDRTDIAQPAPGERLDANSDRLNYRLAYRNFGSSESLIVNQTVRVSPSEPYRAGVRVYEIKRNGGPYSVGLQSTIGDTSESRWIGSAAQDHQGNVAVGYNIASENKRPSIAYTGRLAGDPAGTFRNEEILIGGTGVQRAFGWRWGDYSSISVDPVDDCTFWQTGEYYTQASQDFSEFTWLTRIGRFKFAECTPSPRATIAGTVTNLATGAPIPGTAISIYPYTRTTATDGSFGAINVVPGSYEITVTARGFRQGTAVIPVTDGQTVVRNFALEPIAVVETSGIEFTAESCRVNRVAEPGETITINLPLRNTGNVAAQNVTANILPINGITNVSPTQTYGMMLPGGPAITRQFTFTVSSTVTCGVPLVLPINVSDGFLSLGSILLPLTTGETRVAFSENFDRTLQSSLPVRWTRSASGTGVNWRASTARSQSGIKSAFSPDPINVGINEMQTPVFRVTTDRAKITFRNWYEFETTFLRNRLYDGSLLEIKIGNGEWTDIVAAGGAFESGGYDGTIDACCQNPLAGRLGWSGRSGVNQISEFITTTARLPAAATGQQVQFRFRVGTDIGGFREGQYIDNLVVSDGFVCSCGN